MQPQYCLLRNARRPSISLLFHSIKFLRAKTIFFLLIIICIIDSVRFRIGNITTIIITKKNIVNFAWLNTGGISFYIFYVIISAKPVVIEKKIF